MSDFSQSHNWFTFYNWYRCHMSRKGLKLLFSLLMAIWDRRWIIYKPLLLDSGSSIKKMFSRLTKLSMLFKLAQSYTTSKVYWPCYLFLCLGLRSASSLACEEYGSQCPRGKIRRCLFWSKATLWSGLFPNWYHHNPFPNHKELWHGRVSETGIHEGNNYILAML